MAEEFSGINPRIFIETQHCPKSNKAEFTMLGIQFKVSTHIKQENMIRSEENDQSIKAAQNWHGH